MFGFCILTNAVGTMYTAGRTTGIVLDVDWEELSLSLALRANNGWTLALLFGVTDLRDCDMMGVAALKERCFRLV